MSGGAVAINKTADIVRRHAWPSNGKCGEGELSRTNAIIYYIAQGLG